MMRNLSNQDLGMKHLFKLALSILLFANFSLCKLFPNFTWGAATAAYQVEGAWNIDGKGPSIWDTFTHIPNRTANNATGDVATDFYHRYLEDISTMKSLGIKNFRMSLSWPRLLPNGTVDQPNPQGVDFYNKLIDALLAADIEPWVTLFHWDLPAALDNKTPTGGWLNPNITNIFNDYADFCFENFGDRVKHWITFNEIQVFAYYGYGQGFNAPGRCSPDVASWCQEIGGGGNSSTEPYIVAHHALLSHGLAVQTYRQKYQESQNGTIGLTINTNFAEPYDPSNPDDVAAVDTDVTFWFGWIAHPLTFGSYPDAMIRLVSGDRLPSFTEDQAALLKGSFDFIGINHYTSKFVKYTGIPGNDWASDKQLIESDTDVNGKLIGPYAQSSWLQVYPLGLRKLLKWIDKNYNHPAIYVFENGVSVPNESEMPIEQALNDTFRINYLQDYIGNMILAILEDKIDVRGYFVWSLMDNLEWIAGYDIRFGLIYVDYANNLTRHLKDSAVWYSNLIIHIGEGDDWEAVKEVIDRDVVQISS